jgi:hypothetical protein
MLNSRRHFLWQSSVVVSAMASRAYGLPQAQAPSIPPSRTSPPLPEDLVHEWVWRGHFDLDGVKRMLGEHPTLLNAEYDWGAGDFELAIGGAGHMGRRDIAEYLLSRGARMDIFVATMLGRLDIVKATLVAYPSLVSSKGPHGFTLLHHANKGGTDARVVLEYLQSLGAQ